MSIESLYNSAGIFYAFYLIFYSSFIFVGTWTALRELFYSRKRKLLENVLEHNYYFPVSIIVPAYNESATILTTIDSLLHLEYKIFEIVIVDDGSNDDTAHKVIQAYDLKRQYQPVHLQVNCAAINEVYISPIGNHSIKLIRKDNGGNKADALNAGINASRYPYFVSMDADEILQADALKNSARMFLEDENVIAVGGMLNISNGVSFKNALPVETPLSRNWVAAMQSLEYTRAFMGSRVFNNSFNGNLNVSGGYGLFKKQPVIQIGGYDSNSVGEDMDLAIRLHRYFAKNRIKYSIKYAADAVCWTQAPFSLQDLAKQRARWHRGLIQCMWSHRDFFMAPTYGYISVVSYTYFFFYELAAPIIELFGVFLLILAIFINYINWPVTIMSTLLYSIFSVLQTLIFFSGRYFVQEHKYYKGDFLWAIFISLADLLLFRPYLLGVRLFATITYKKYLHSWNKITREAFD